MTKRRWFALSAFSLVLVLWAIGFIGFVKPAEAGCAYMPSIYHPSRDECWFTGQDCIIVYACTPK
jgi:hypothetical protein